MGAKGTPSPARWLKHLVYGPHPISVILAGSVDSATTRQLSGRHSAGQLRFGEASSPAMKFSGDLGPQQDMRGGAFYGSSRNLRRSGENRALPATTAASGNPVLNSLAAVMPLDSSARRA